MTPENSSLGFSSPEMIRRSVAQLLPTSALEYALIEPGGSRGNKTPEQIRTFMLNLLAYQEQLTGVRGDSPLEHIEDGGLVVTANAALQYARQQVEYQGFLDLPEATITPAQLRYLKRITTSTIDGSRISGNPSYTELFLMHIRGELPIADEPHLVSATPNDI